MKEVRGSIEWFDLPNPDELVVLLLVLLLAVATRLDRVDETGELGIPLLDVDEVEGELSEPSLGFVLELEWLLLLLVVTREEKRDQ